MSGVEFKFLAMPNVDFEMRVSSVESVWFLDVGCQIILAPVSDVVLEKYALSSVGKYPFMGPIDGSIKD